MNSQSTLEWLTVTEAAAAAGVSEKTLRKRIARGEVEAEKVTLAAGGWAWRVAPVRLEAVGSRDGSGLEAVGTPAKAVREETGADVPTDFQPREGSALELPTAFADSMAGELVAQLKSENAFLRLQVEAANRTAAEAQAALREALKMSARQLTEGTQSTLESVPSAPAESRAMAADQAQSTLKGKEAPEPMKAPQIEAAPKYFERSKGLRSWLLKVLRG
jgi:hypothetical protein